MHLNPDHIKEIETIAAQGSIAQDEKTLQSTTAVPDIVVGHLV